MAIFNEFPQTNFHELNLDWILSIIKKLKEDWEKFNINWSDELQAKVDNWLDAHPEATTTVLDHSLTSVKFSYKIPFYNVLDYGIEPNNGDVYDALYDLLADHVYNTGGVVFFPKGKYTISDCLFIPENTVFLGEGSGSEIYFDETHTYYGTGLSNAGSNVAIMNMKVSQLSTGTFHSGSQPGCIGFSDNHKDMTKAGKHTTTLTRAACYNLAVIDLYVDGFYALQTENDSSYPITNVTYKNIYAPESCVSVEASTAGIYNIVMDNISCDLFRIDVNMTNGVVDNAFINNMSCQTFLINHHNLDGNIIVNNMQQTDDVRKNDLLTIYNGAINGNITFNNCIFRTISVETGGISLLNGIRSFNNCEFYVEDKIFTRNAALSDSTNYELMESNVIHNNPGADTSFLLGYGHNNRIDNPDVIYKWLWGDLRAEKHTGIFSASTDVTSTIKPTLYALGDRIRIVSYNTFSQNDLILPLDTKLEKFPTIKENIPVMIWNSSDRSGTAIMTCAFIDSDGYLKIQEYGYETSTSYDRIMINTEIPVTDIPTPSQIFNLLAA